jgi:hypothetical protein
MQAFQRVGQKPEHEQPRSLCAKSAGNAVPRAWCRKTWDWMLDISIGYGDMADRGGTEDRLFVTDRNAVTKGSNRPVARQIGPL